MLTDPWGLDAGDGDDPKTTQSTMGNGGNGSNQPGGDDPGAGSTTTVDDGIVAGNPTPQTPASPQGVVATQTKPGTKPGPKPYTKPVGFDEAGLPYDKVKSDRNNSFVYGSSGIEVTDRFTADDLYNTEKYPWRTVIPLESGELGVVTRLSDVDGGQTPVMMSYDQTTRTWTTLIPIFTNDRKRQDAIVAEAQAQAQRMSDELDLWMNRIIWGGIGIAAIAATAGAAAPFIGAGGAGGAAAGGALILQSSPAATEGTLGALATAAATRAPQAIPATTSVYRYVVDGVTRYVGISIDPIRRGAKHLREKGLDGMQVLVGGLTKY
ncbi:hypothetical protein [Aphanothece stagnina]|uniref:hypothetical protein n=1 Tax=Aphanothece stagnina TaxID=1004305 RepID=UPI00398EED23